METKESIEPPYTSFHGSLSAEKMALIDFLHSLGSTHLAIEPGNADDGATRQEAELLMSLLSSSPSRLEELDFDLVSTSESEHSFESSEYYHPTGSSARRAGTFRFTCPSLSLEHLERSGARASRPTTLGRMVSDDPVPPSPSTLLQRSLRVEDRDALRLSADAMARNMRLTIQTALQFRADSWIRACAAVLVEKEEALRQNGASQEELLDLLQTKEALVIQGLRSAAGKILVTAAVTSFEIVAPLESQGSSMPANKKQRTAEQGELHEADTYQYKASYHIVLKIIAALETPAGFSEIAFDVPGTVEGTFGCLEDEAVELRSVVIEVDSKILAAMVEKSTRTVVRVSTQSLLESFVQEVQEQLEEQKTSSSVPAQDIMTPQKESVPAIPQTQHSSSALVTPARQRSPASSTYDDHAIKSGSPKPILWPIPDNLSGSCSEKTNDLRRVSPQPHASPKNSSGPSSFLVPRRALFQANESAMVTPYANEASKHYEETENGPSLPLLVAAACQVMDDKR